jgi:phosphomannomutase/phosphoglucomutase
MPQIDPHIFRAYDIRGKAGAQMTVEACKLIGEEFGKMLQENYGAEHPHPTVALGRDARTHSPDFENALRDGLLSAGCRVLNIGETPSPVNYFTICNEGFDAGVQITASHNPKEDNGIKLQIRNAEAFSGENLQMLRKRIEASGKDKGLGTKDKGRSENLDATTPYVQKVTSLVPSLQGLKVVVDFGNGVAGPVYGAALQKAGVELTPLFEKPDGTFPNHIADPSNHATLKTLQETVRKEKADCGIAFDGDGDRVGFVDEEGKVVSADYLLLLLAEDHLQRNPRAPIVYTVSMSSILETEVKRLGGHPIMCPVGHSFVEHTMKKEESHLGGEQSGHFFCGENFYDHDDALVAALRVLSIFSERRKPKKPRKPKNPTNKNSLDSLDSLDSLESFSQLFSHYPKIFQSPEWRPHCDDAAKGDVIRKITAHFEKKYPCVTMDGVRIDFGEGAWAGIRQSNTSPKISVCIETRNPEKLQELETLVKEHLRTYSEIGA